MRVAIRPVQRIGEPAGLLRVADQPVVEQVPQVGVGELGRRRQRDRRAPSRLAWHGSATTGGVLTRLLQVAVAVRSAPARMAATTAAVNSVQLAVPPRSRVQVPSRPRSRRRPPRAGGQRRPAAGRRAVAPSQSSSIALERFIAIGLAMSWPAMSGAEPCAACAIAWVSEEFSEGAMPSEPAISPARSERMSPNMFSVTMTSKSSARRTRCTVMASMWKSSTSTSGYSCATSRQTSRNRPVVIFSTLALCTIVTLLRRRVRQLERGVGDPFGGGPGDDAVHDRDVGSGHHLAGAAEGVAVGVEAFGVLASDDQVGALDDRLAALEGLGGTDVRVQVEVLADGPARVELAAERLGVAALSCGPSSQPSRSSSALRVDSGVCAPNSSMAAAPRGSSCQSIGSTPAASTAASTMATEEGTISGPMPSPRRTPSR